MDSLLDQTEVKASEQPVLPEVPAQAEVEIPPVEQPEENKVE